MTSGVANRIEAAAVVKPAADGALTDNLLIKERRSKKVGALPTKARLVLAAAQRCVGVSAAAIAAPESVGVSLGTLYGSMDVAEQCLQTAHASGFGHVTPSWYATGLANATTAIVASMHDLRGPNLTVLGYPAGIEAIIFGCRQILARRARAMLAGGFDLASDAYTARVRAAPDFADAAAIHPGAGLVWLVEGGEPTANATTIVGWSQGVIAEHAFAQGEFGSLIESAAGGKLQRAPMVHVIRPGRRGLVDYLAATPVIHLIEDVVTAGKTGRHALIVKGFGPAVICLLLEKSSG
ncbi:MAG: beta-ketoacyl synthase N-terminal-like domain-containing protein [Sulfurifustis sp.]